jgi:hypothetical protein
MVDLARNDVKPEPKGPSEDSFEAMLGNEDGGDNLDYIALYQWFRFLVKFTLNFAKCHLNLNENRLV